MGRRAKARAVRGGGVCNVLGYQAPGRGFESRYVIRFAFSNLRLLILFEVYYRKPLHATVLTTVTLKNAVAVQNGYDVRIPQPYDCDQEDHSDFLMRKGGDTDSQLDLKFEFTGKDKKYPNVYDFLLDAGKIMGIKIKNYPLIESGKMLPKDIGCSFDMGMKKAVCILYLSYSGRM
ncbi:hypothetical protein Y032_0049g1812 [Ancylostoma ceylanicum]|uniref:Uncharacterized protein n=1 Tax=Ancylostoma ceylanicum TaxID=53326 RepID=A0A016U958_9BILA|nr:hypothetical protein Y032_0049g1812 [Ancylostoma ceylanicum]